jgi:hypothetical protein
MAEIGQGIIRGRRLIACCDGTWNKPDRHGQRYGEKMAANIGEADPLLIWSTLAAIAAYGPGNRPA